VGPLGRGRRSGHPGHSPLLRRQARADECLNALIGTGRTAPARRAPGP
jgi:hypothetical protein